MADRNSKLRNAARWARRVWEFRLEGAMLGALGVMILAAIVGLAIVFATMAGCQSEDRKDRVASIPVAELDAILKRDQEITEAELKKPNLTDEQRAFLEDSLWRTQHRRSRLSDAPRGDAAPGARPSAPPPPAMAKPRPVAPTPQIPDGDTAIISTASTIGAVSRWTLALSALALVASFLPVVGSFIPRREVAYCGLAAIGLGIVQYWVLEYGRGFAIASFWIGLVLGVAMLGLVLYPVIRAMWRKALLDDAKNRVAAGDPIAATALHVAATPERFRTPGAKRAMLAALSSASGTLTHGRTPSQEVAPDAPR